jgi:C-terminal processing protease CtpA/Prc
MNRLRIMILSLILGVVGSTALADSPSTEAASRAWAITELVLARNVDPPTRQQMILAAIKAVAKEGHDSLPSGMARQVSDLSGADQLASLLAETWANSKLVDRETRDVVFFNGLLSSVPGDARLLSAKERKVEESFEANLYVGIQVALGVDAKAKKPVFLQILEGGPAEHAGAKQGDLIEEIDGVSAEGMPLVQIINRLRGEEGTDVLVKFSRPQTSEVFTKAMTRGRLFRPTVQGLSPLPEKRWSVRFEGPQPIGYLKIKEISGSTPRELRAFAEQLESEGVKALVLDLRETTTARFHPTVLVADALLDGGVIGRVKSVDGEKVYRAEPDALFRGWPMVVLASTTLANNDEEAEIVWLCDALRDNQRATILGNPLVVGEPYVSEMVAIPGDERSVQMATGLLLRGDGQPLARRSTRGSGREVTVDLERMNKNTQDNLERMNKNTQEMNAIQKQLNKQTLELLELLTRANVNLDASSREQINRSLEDLRKPSSNPVVAVPSGPVGFLNLVPNLGDFRRAQSPEQDLAKAREILAEALKAAGKP